MGVDVLTGIQEGAGKKIPTQLIPYPNGQGKKRNHRP